MAVIGIDLGTTNSLCAIWRNGKSELVPNSFSEFLTPSVVSIDENGTLYIGKIAKERLISHPELTASLFKRQMGSGTEFHLGKQAYLPEELSALVLRQLREDAERFTGEPVTEAIISVPAYFNDYQRSATKRAGKLAGLHVERLVNEPSAAALASYIAGGDPATYRNYIVFDFGGGTLDVSVVECFENIVSILAVCGDNHLGGSDFDEVMAQYFCQQNGIQFKDLSETGQAILLRQAELSKFELSKKNSTEMKVVNQEITGSIIIGNQKLIEISSALFRRIEQPVRHALKDSGLGKEDIHSIILVGGSCHMPIVKQYLEHICGIKTCEYGSPDTSVALGLGVYVGIKERCSEIKDFLLTDICPFSLGINVHNRIQPHRSLMSVLIERNSALPTSKESRFCTAGDWQKDIRVGVYQGESMYTEDNVLLGEINMSVTPAPGGQESIDVRFTYDINGILEVDAVNVSSQQRERLVIISKGSSLTDYEVEKRISELAKLKIHPRDEDENKLVLARAERLFEETTGSLRETIMLNYEVFMGILEKQERLAIKKMRAKFIEFLDQFTTGMSDQNSVLFRFDNDGDDK